MHCLVNYVVTHCAFALVIMHAELLPGYYWISGADRATNGATQSVAKLCDQGAYW
jgi:hypothetical protein